MFVWYILWNVIAAVSEAEPVEPEPTVEEAVEVAEKETEEDEAAVVEDEDVKDNWDDDDDADVKDNWDESSNDEPDEGSCRHTVVSLSVCLSVHLSDECSFI